MVENAIVRPKARRRSIFRAALRATFRLVWYLLPSQRPALVVSDVLNRIEDLESAKDFEEAQSVRKDALATVPPAFSAPLWRSEGYERLRLGDAVGALAAFENGIAHLNESPALFGVAAPDRLYYGAAMAALKSDSVQMARDYYERFVVFTASIAERVKRERLPEWWDEGRNWLRQRLDEDSSG